MSPRLFAADVIEQMRITREVHNAPLKDYIEALSQELDHLSLELETCRQVD